MAGNGFLRVVPAPSSSLAEIEDADEDIAGLDELKAGLVCMERGQVAAALDHIFDGAERFAESHGVALPWEV